MTHELIEQASSKATIISLCENCVLPFFHEVKDNNKKSRGAYLFVNLLTWPSSKFLSMGLLK